MDLAVGGFRTFVHVELGHAYCANPSQDLSTTPPSGEKHEVYDRSFLEVCAIQKVGSREEKKVGEGYLSHGFQLR